MEMKIIGPRGARPKFYYVDPPLLSDLYPTDLAGKSGITTQFKEKLSDKTSRETD